MAAGGPFLFHLPASVLWEFCRIMDGLSDLDWTRFASEVLRDQTSLRLAEKKERRTDWVMNQWENRNGRVCELIDLLEHLQLLRPRDVILRWMSSLRPPPAPLPPPLPPPPPTPLASSQFDPPPKQPEATPTQCTCRLSDVDKGGGGGGGPLPKPAPPPSGLQSVPHHPPQCPLMVPDGGAMNWSYKEVHAGTDGFSPVLQIGEGGFGVVYKATLRRTDCAVKRLKQDSVLDWALLKESFYTEVEKLTRFRHPNIVELLGFSKGPECVCLIYSYMENRSLDDQLHNEGGALSWSQRVSVVEGASKALQFLHNPPEEQKPLIHGDVKSSNILLDRHLVAKLADFGLARFACGSTSGLSGVSRTVTVGKTETVRGTLAYLPEEYVRNGLLGPAVDVYSFGVVLLEVLTGRRALERDKKSGERYLKDLVEEVEDSSDGPCPAAWRRQLDHQLISGGAAEPVGCMEMVALACKCLNKNRKKRPSMIKVFDKLQDIHHSVRGTNLSSSPLRHPHLQPSSKSLPRPPCPLDSSVEALSQQLSTLGPLEDTYHPSMSSTSSSSSFSSFSFLSPPDPLHSSSSLPHCSSSFVGPCETDESRGFSQYDLRSQCRSNGSSSRSLSPYTRNQSPSPAGPSKSQMSQPSVPTEDQYNFPPLPGSTIHSAGAALGPVTGGPTTGGATAGLYGFPRSLSPAGSLHSSSPGPSVVINPSKQHLLQKKTLYDEGRIRTPELLSAEDLYGGRSSVEPRGPEESDELAYLPAQHT